MAEAAGLAIGAASLAGLFLTCIEYMECFNLDRNLGQDSEASVGKMMLLEAKLTAWGASLRVVEVGSVLPILRGRWNQEQETIGKALVGIKNILQDSRTLEKIDGLERITWNDSQIVSTPDAENATSLQDIEHAFRSSANNSTAGNIIMEEDTLGCSRQKEVRCID